MPLQHSLLDPIQELERAYQFFNQQLFSNTLNEKVIITIQTRGRRTNALAWYWQQRWGADKDEVIAEINFSAETLCLSDPYESLIHEMVHHACALQGIKDTSRGNKYHNKRFKEQAELAGLECQNDQKVGWAYTSLGERATRAKEELKPKPELFKYLRFGEETKKRKKKLKKWKCDCYSVWSEASNEIKAVCQQCGQEFDS